ncbi:LysE family translocator [Solirubrobacter soli]|uniref:LysE family translocator n=1 Tax=Solirubrobacter soli TaxID=363832 RepID=UPI0004198C13|nr:LysE family translocator [Solirubrobacter soli]
MLWAFLPIAALVTITPGAATAMVIRSAMRGGWTAGLRTIAGNSIGVVAWALLSIAGISALVAASEVAFIALKVTGALVLVWLGIQSFRRAGSAVVELEPRRARAFRDGLITSLANPKLAVFFVALFPQFVGARGDVLPTTLAMAAMIVCLDFVWYSTLAILASRAKAGFMASRAGRWMERVTGSVLIALGVRVALD